MNTAGPATPSQATTATTASQDPTEHRHASQPRWQMPPETAPQERVWMAFPPNVPNTGETPEAVDIARRVWADVANTIVGYEPVTMVVDPADTAIAASYLDKRVETMIAPLNDAWMRDIGPTFVLSEDGRELGAVEWVFNGWGQQDWAQWDKDSKIGGTVGSAAQASALPSNLVNEGGGIHVDGSGTVLLTETVQRDPQRNPGLTRAEIETEIHAKLGTRQAIWLPRGLYRDGKRFGTRGHVDIVATFPAPSVVLIHDQRDPEHPDHELSAELKELFSRETTADGQPWTILTLPAPKQLRDEEDFVDYSYINHLVINGAVIACTFNDPHDDEALTILAKAYPGREIVGIDAREIFARGGGVHCITQQQPATQPSTR